MTTTPAVRAQLAVGSTMVTYIPDGHGNFSSLFAFPQADWADHPTYLDADGRVTLSFGAFLIRSGDDVVLVDLGVGAVDLEVQGIGHVRGGTLLDSLAAEGVAPADIDHVVYTHLHPDHVGWTSDIAGSPFATPTGTESPTLTFPHARYRVTKEEWAYWWDNEIPLGPDRHTVLEPLSRIIDFIADGDTIAPGVTVRSTPGHTPGHIAVEIKDPLAAPDSASIVIAGDCLHSPIQLAAPDLRFPSDVDPEQAQITRTALLGQTGAVIAAGHFPGHVFGRVTQTQGDLTWSPVHRL